MRRMARLLTGLALTLAGAVAAPAGVACACSCRELTTAEAVASATAVFDGEVLAATVPSTGSSLERLRYTLRVSRVYKGSVPAEVTVGSAASEASCGVRLAGTVTVFAYGDEAALTTGLCSAPGRLDRAALGPGTPPSTSMGQSPPATPAQPQPGTTGGPMPDVPTPAFGPGAVLLLGIGVIIWLMSRRRR